MESMIIIGTGGFAIELAGLLKSIDIEVTGFIGPKPTIKLPAKWLGNDEYIETLHSNTKILIAIGEPKIRSKLVAKIKQKKLQQQTFVYPDSYISPSASIAIGSIIYPNVTIHAGVILGEYVLINSNTTIGHETIIGEYSNIGPGVSIGGCCKIGDKAYIGIGASTIENITISNQVIIGAGATVVTDIKSTGIYIGVPAKKIEKN
jgi:sugar O-acyltransferase (sialic acid O-acetyltransferase NeuD family)